MLYSTDVHNRWKKNHFCFDTACMAREKAATRYVGPGFNGSELATRLEGDQIGHGQDGMNRERLEWLFITGPVDTTVQYCISQYKNNYR